MQKNEIEFAKEALEHHLFVRDWQMENYYHNIINGNEFLGIHIFYLNELAIASCIIDLEEDWLNVFVKEEYRGNKYGQQLVMQTLEKYDKNPNEVYGMEGIEGSEKFYNSCGIAYFQYGLFEMSKEESKLFAQGEISMKEIRQKSIDKYFQHLNNATKPKIKIF